MKPKKITLNLSLEKDELDLVRGAKDFLEVRFRQAFSDLEEGKTDDPILLMSLGFILDNFVDPILEQTIPFKTKYLKVKQ